MADDVREYVRAAQAAELRGDVPDAVASLKKAATLYRAQGKTERALQMLRHASRLSGSPALEEEVHRMDWSAERPLDQAVQAVHAGLAAHAERRPVKADPAADAWCSFCCRPKTEVGPLVAGASAFVCASCARDAQRLLAPDPAPAPATAAPEGARRPVAFVGQQPAAKTLEAALAFNARAILQLGPPGSGKTTWLADLEARGVGVRVVEPRDLAKAAPEQRVLIDLAVGVGLAPLLSAAGPRPVLVAATGKLPAPILSLVSAGLELPVYPSDVLEQATSGLLPRSAAERFDVVVELACPSAQDLEPVARALLERRAPEVKVSDALVSALAAAAAASPTGGHELHSLVARIPAGTWGVKAVAPPALIGKRRRKSVK